MVEYIEREALIKMFSGGESLKSIAESIADERFIEAIKKVPAADVKEVVKCKECKHRYEPVNCALWYATYNGKEYFRDHGGEFSCSFGERKGAAVHGDPIPAEACGKV